MSLLIKLSSNGNTVDLSKVSDEIEAFVEDICELYENQFLFIKNDLENTSDTTDELSDIVDSINLTVRDSCKLSYHDGERAKELKNDIFRAIIDCEDEIKSKFGDIVHDFKVDIDDLKYQIKEERDFSKKIVLACSKYTWTIDHNK